MHRDPSQVQHTGEMGAGRGRANRRNLGKFRRRPSSAVQEARQHGGPGGIGEEGRGGGKIRICAHFDANRRIEARSWNLAEKESR